MLKQRGLETVKSDRVSARYASKSDPLLREVREEMERDRARTAADAWSNSHNDAPREAMVKARKKLASRD